MKEKTQFNSENILMSVLGHLILIAIMMISFSAAINETKLVTPNHVEIVELDLKYVKVSDNETKLYNTTTPEPDKNAKQDKKDETPSAEEDKKEEIKETTLIEDETKKKEKTKKKEEKKKPETPAPRKKISMQINRGIALVTDDQLNANISDYVRHAVKGCWKIDKDYPNISDIRLTVHVKMKENKTVDFYQTWIEQESRADTDPAFAYVRDTVKDALQTCRSLPGLPSNSYDKWQDIVLTFYPAHGEVK